MPSAFSHDPAITTPGSSTDNAIVIFDGTGGSGFGNSTILVDSGGNGRIGIAGDTDVIIITADTVTVAGTVAATTLTGAGAGITALAAGNITASGTLPALNGAALTALNGTQVTSGTLPAARIGDDSIVEAKLDVSNAPTNGYYLQAQSGEGGGLTWATAGGTTVNGTADNAILTYINSSGEFTAETALTFSSGVLANATANSGGTNQITLSNTSANANSHAFLDMENGASGGDQGNVGIFIHGESSNFYYIGMQAANPVMSIGAHSSKSLGNNDTMRFSDAAPPVITYNTAHPTGAFDYVCESCGKHSHQIFTCCGKVEWHDDILAIREAAIDMVTIDNTYAPGASMNIDHMVRLGVMEYDTTKPEYLDQAGPWLGINLKQAQWFTWAGMYQNRERMDAYHAELKAEIEELKTEIKALKE